MMKALIWVMLCGLTMALPAQDDPQNEALNIIDVDEAKQSIGDVISDVIDEIGDVISDMCQEIVEVNELIDDKVLMTKDICLTRQCIEASNRLFQNMREDADPCEDFNEFACGRFETETIIPDDAGKYTSLSLIQDIVLERLRQLLEAEIDEKTDFEGHKKAKIYYKSCMNEDKQEALGVEPIKEYLAKYGGWPVLEGDKWSGDNFDLWALLAKESFNNNILVNTKIASDAMNSSWRVIHFDQTSLGLSREYLVKGFEEKEVKSYFKSMVDAAVLLGVDRDKAKTELKLALEFEIKLANISTPREERRDGSKLYNPTTLGNMKTGPGLPESWTTYVQDLFDLPNVNFKIEATEKVIIMDVNYYANLTKVLGSTDNKVIANYLGWRVVETSLQILNDKARSIEEDVYKAMHGTVQAPAIWKMCVHKTKKLFKHAVSSMYVMVYFKPEAKNEINIMINYIRDAFNDILDDIEWLDEDTKESARLKLNFMDQVVGYSDEILEQDKIDGVYEDIEVTKDEYFGNTIRILTNENGYLANQLREQIDPRDWRTLLQAAEANARYEYLGNAITLPAAYLQGFLFDNLVPRYMNYGSIGWIIGHEITHGFDDQGRKFNYLGDLVDWWKPETAKKFEARAQCIIWQYGNYSIGQIEGKLNGIRTQGDDIADNGGIRQAYLAYDKWVSDNGEEQGLPGHPYSSRQLFWISAAQIWCSKYRDTALKNQIETDVHSPGKFRTIGPLSNNDDFARDFNCPLGSKMNPKEKCIVW